MGPIATLEQLGRSYRTLDSHEIQREYPFKNLPDHYVGIFQEDNAVIDVKEVMDTAATVAREAGVKIASRCRATHLESNSAGVVVTLSDGTRLRGRKAIVAAGAYINELLRTPGST